MSMSTALFSFKDAVHDTGLHGGRFGFVHGCVACAQTEADMALSAKAARTVQQSAPVTNLPIYVKAA
jgi:hypothetical protein